VPAQETGDQARQARRRALEKLTTPKLVRACLMAGIEGAAPLHTWSRDDLIATILRTEFRQGTTP
jgi:uncharacterized membrane protein